MKNKLSIFIYFCSNITELSFSNSTTHSFCILVVNRFVPTCGWIRSEIIPLMRNKLKAIFCDIAQY